jgi:WD40 repeat protein
MSSLFDAKKERCVQRTVLEHRFEGSDTQLLDVGSAQIKRDVVRLIGQYLEEEGYVASLLTLQDESRVKLRQENASKVQWKALESAVLRGDWASVHRLCKSEALFSNQPTVLFELYKQEYLELIDRQERQKAYGHLQQRLKPLESVVAANVGRGGSFEALCYLLTCKSVEDGPRDFSDWRAGRWSREKLVERVAALLGVDEGRVSEPKDMPDGRLKQLLVQAAAYQVELARYHPKAPPSVTSLLRDYRCIVLPNAERSCLRGHTQNVKCVQFVGDAGWQVASGSSDNTVRLWSVDANVYDEAQPDASNDDPPASSLTESHVFRGHKSRIWSLASNRRGDRLASASGDSTVRIWNTGSSDEAKDSEASSSSSKATVDGVSSSSLLSTSSSSSSPSSSSSSSPTSSSSFGSLLTTLRAHDGDVYTVRFHHDQRHVATGGYDKTVRLFDVETGTLLKTFMGHRASVTCVIFNPHGNLMISGSKDNTVKFFDITSGHCINTFSAHLGEVSSVDTNASGSLVLSGSKDNSNRLWDARTCRVLRRFKGHQHTSRNFVRCQFGPSDRLVIGGSEDGLVYIWDADTGSLLERLRAHRDVVYSAVWNERQSLLATCSDDNTVRTWHYR